MYSIHAPRCQIVAAYTPHFLDFPVGLSLTSQLVYPRLPSWFILDFPVVLTLTSQLVYPWLPCWFILDFPVGLSLTSQLVYPWLPSWLSLTSHLVYPWLPSWFILDFPVGLSLTSQLVYHWLPSWLSLTSHLVYHIYMQLRCKEFIQRTIFCMLKKQSQTLPYQILKQIHPLKKPVYNLCILLFCLCCHLEL